MRMKGIEQMSRILKPGEPARPTEIFREPEEIVQALRVADMYEWLVRFGYTSGSGKTSEVTVDILVFTDSVIDAQAAAMPAPR